MTYSGPSLATVLVAIFATLKLTDNIDWSWWWVFSPWLIAGGIALVATLIIAVVTALTD
ncbi:membrane protein [Mycobacterium phage Nanosmite]|nr:membrane protein [Mycobacterium phage Nanosmite]